MQKLIVYGSNNELIKTLVIPSSVTGISGNVFNNCTNLENINVDGENTTYASSEGILYNYDKTSFIYYPQGKKESSLTILDTVTSISGTITSNNLTSIEIPASVKSMNGSLTFDCENLTNINVDDNNSEYSSDNGVLLNKTKTELIICPKAKTEVNIPDSVTNIGDYAFENCSGLTNVNIPASVTNIGDYAFKNCSGLTQVKIPNSVTDIGYSAFNNCTSLKSITIPNSVTTLKYNTFGGCSSLEEITLSDKITAIEGTVFSDCTNLKNITLPNNIKYIEENLFENCSNLENIKIPNGVIEIKDYAFKKCTSLTNITFSDKLQGIGNNAFEGCESFTNIEIPSNVKSIGYNAFSGCENLVIICEINTKAQEYAKNNSINYTLKFGLKCENEEIYNKLKEKLNEYIIKENPQELELILDNNITNLDISNLNVKDISWVQYLTKLETLNASNNQISDISALDSLNITDLNLNNQKIQIDTLKQEIDMPDILVKAVSEKYASGQDVTYTTNNVTVENNKKMKMADEFGIGNDATVTVNNGVINGTECTIKPSEKVRVELKKNGDIVAIEAYEGDKKLDITDIDLYYALNNSENYNKYTEAIVLEGKEANIQVKFFNNIILDENIEINIAVTAIRKNGRISIYTNGSSNNNIQYSLTGNDFVDYSEPIENSDIKNIFVKLGNDEAKEIEIQEIKNSNYDIYDVNTKTSMFGVAKRKNGEVKVTGKFNQTEQTVYFYSFDKEKWTKFTSVGELTVNNLEADTIYIKAVKKAENSSLEISYYTIYNDSDDEFGKLTGIYNENGKSYIFGQERTYSKEISNEKFTKYTIVDDDNDIQKLLDEEVLDVTSVAGNVLILKQDGKVYQIGKMYNELLEVTGAKNFTQIDGIYALDNENNIWKYKYNYADNTCSYVKCDEYNVKGEVEKLASIIREDSSKPYILYTNGEAVILNDDGTAHKVADNVIDISADEENYYAIQFNTLIYNGETVDLASIVANGEIPIKINKQGDILTNKENYYEMSVTYSNEYVSKIKELFEERVWNYTSPEKNKLTELEYIKLSEISNITYNSTRKTGIVKMGDYTYQDKNGNVYYRNKGLSYDSDFKPGYGNTEVKESRIFKKLDDDITVTKDERKLNENKVIINVQVPENTYTIKKPDGTNTNEKNISYEVTKNGEYVFEFTDSEGNVQIRVVHVTTIQNRKETKVPGVVALNGKIMLASNDKIEYSMDNKNWNEYTEEIDYKEPIYARINNDAYECSILKITLDENGELNVENTESREIEYEILTNSIGVKYNKDIKYDVEDDSKQEEKSNEDNKNLLTILSNIADKIIYSFSTTDGKYAGCYFEDNVTEITYKDIDNTSAGINGDDYKLENSSNIEYSVICKNDSDGVDYAYIDSDGNLISNIETINKAKEELKKRNENIKYTKIVGDGVTFYILTEKGEVYLVSGGDNGTWEYLLNKLDINKHDADLGGEDENHFIMLKLDVRDIVNIYDSCTALTKDGKMISLIKDNEEDTSAVQELQKQTDKYLVKSHLGLKDGKLYNFDNIQQGEEVTAGKIVESTEAKYGIYSEDKKQISLFENEYSIPSKAGNEFYIDVEPLDSELPEFVDIVEQRNGYLAMLVDIINKEKKTAKEDYTNDPYTLCYAISKDGEIWTYINGYIIDTGINLDYFGPTVNYKLSDIDWTNQDINLTPSGNTTGKIVKTVIYKGDKEIYNSETNNNNNIEKVINTNGDYKIVVQDNKGREYTSNLNVVNIDKIKPVITKVDGEIIDGNISVKVYDVEDETGDYAISGIDRVQFTLEEPTEQTKWTDLDAKIDEQGNMIIELEDAVNNIKEKIIYTQSLDENGNVVLNLKNNFGNEKELTIFARTIDKAGNIGDNLKIVLPAISTGNVIAKYQDTQGNKIADDIILTGEIGKTYKTEKKEIDTYEFIEVVGEEEGKFTETVQEVIYKYKKIEIPEPKQGKVTAKYQDIEGNKLADDKVLTGKVDESYKTEKISIDGYEFIEVEGNEEGKFTEAVQEVIYKYKKIEIPESGEGKLIVKYQDKEGNKLKEDIVTVGKIGESYMVEKTEIYKYKLVEVEGNEEGKYTKEDQVVIYKYEKLTGKVIIKYIDTDGNSLLEDKIITGKVDELYKADRIEIDGYNFIEVEGNENGIYMLEDQLVMFKYEKIKQPVIPKTGQARIIYIILGIIIFVSVSGLSYLDLSKKNKKK